MALAQSQFLKISDAAGLVYYRWQNYYATAVDWSSQSWLPVSFIAEGLTSGINGQESDINITAVAITGIAQALERAILKGHLAELTVYQFDTILGNSTPQASQQLVGSYLGQVIGGSASLTSITMQVGASLAPIGAQMPPRRFTTAIMGQGCRL